MVFSIPPLMIRIPTLLPFGIQIPPPVIRFTAVIALVMDRFVESCFRPFDCMLALVFLVGVDARCGHK